jgi:hypothetical protein
MGSVLPTLVPVLSYDGMAVANGQDAGLAWESLVKGNLEQCECESVEKALRAYCGPDTLALLKLLENLRLASNRQIDWSTLRLTPRSSALPRKPPVSAELISQLLLLLFHPFDSLEQVMQTSFRESILKSFTALRTEICPLAFEWKDILAPAAALSVDSLWDVVQAREILADGALSNV